MHAPALVASVAAVCVAVWWIWASPAAQPSTGSSGLADVLGERLRAEQYQGILPGDVTANFTAPGAVAVERLEWEPKKLFVDAMAKRKAPAVLRHTQADLWAANKKWTPSYLLGALPSLRMHESRHNIIRMHSPKQPLGTVHGVKWSRPWQYVQVAPQEFFQSTRNLYYSQNLAELPPGLDADVQPRDFLQKGQFHMFDIIEQNFWVSLPNMTSPAHYDMPMNFYVQLYGRKRFVLYPPEDWASLPLFPRMHPSTRMSQPDWSQPMEALLENFPTLASLHPQEVVLHPGDMLYIPPFWGHHVTAVDVSISLSTHIEAAEQGRRRKLMEVEVPFDDAWPVHFRLSALRVFLRATMPDLAARCTSVVGRYDKLRHDHDAEGLWERIQLGSVEVRADIRNAEGVSPTSLTNTAEIEKAAQKAQKILSNFDAGVRAVLAEDYIEDLVHVAAQAGPTVVPAVVAWLGTTS